MTRRVSAAFVGIELAIANIKTILWAIRARTIAALEHAITEALDQISAS